MGKFTVSEEAKKLMEEIDKTPLWAYKEGEYSKPKEENIAMKSNKIVYNGKNVYDKEQ